MRHLDTSITLVVPEATSSTSSTLKKISSKTRNFFGRRKKSPPTSRDESEHLEVKKSVAHASRPTSPFLCVQDAPLSEVSPLSSRSDVTATASVSPSATSGSLWDIAYDDLHGEAEHKEYVEQFEKLLSSKLKASGNGECTPDWVAYA